MPEGYGFKYKVTRVGSDRLTVAAEFVNGSLHPVYLQRFLLLDTPRGGFTVRGAAADWMLATTDVRRAAWERSSGRFLRKMRFG